MKNSAPPNMNVDSAEDAMVGVLGDSKGSGEVKLVGINGAVV